MIVQLLPGTTMLATGSASTSSLRLLLARQSSSTIVRGDVLAPPRTKQCKSHDCLPRTSGCIIVVAASWNNQQIANRRLEYALGRAFASRRMHQFLQYMQQGRRTGSRRE